MTDTTPAIRVRSTLNHEEWNRAFSAWLNTRTDNTARAYRQAWASLIEHSSKVPGELESMDVAGWVEWMKGEQLNPATINLRLAGISSFYRFLGEASRQPLANPTAGLSLRQRAFRWQGARYLGVESARRLMVTIERESARGARDYALLAAYLFTGRRNSEIRTLRWGDIEQNGEQSWYRWQGKGKSRRDVLPEPVMKAILDYVCISGRQGSMTQESCIFISSRKSEHEAPLSASQVGRILNGHLMRAGIETHYRVHDLRHTAAMLRKAAGEDIESISQFLNHSNINTTMIYLHALEGRRDAGWKAVESLLNFDHLSPLHSS